MTLWTAYGNHYATCSHGFSAEVVETKDGCIWFVYIKMTKHLEEGFAHNVVEAKAEAEACLRRYVDESEGITRRIV